MLYHLILRRPPHKGYFIFIRNRSWFSFLEIKSVKTKGGLNIGILLYMHFKVPAVASINLTCFQQISLLRFRFAADLEAKSALSILENSSFCFSINILDKCQSVWEEHWK